MSSRATRSYHLGGRPAPPLAATVRRRFRTLTVLFLVGTLVGFLAIRSSGVDLIATVNAAYASDSIRTLVVTPLTTRLLELEIGSLLGLLAVVVATPLFAAADHDWIRLRNGASAFVVAVVAGLVGALLAGVVGVDFVRSLVASGLVSTAQTGGRYWLTELAICLPVVSAVGFALPAALVGAVRSNLVGRRWTGRRRGIAVLSGLVFVSIYSPTDSVTFVVSAALVLGGLVLGLGLIEFDVC